MEIITKAKKSCTAYERPGSRKPKPHKFFTLVLKQKMQKATNTYRNYYKFVVEYYEIYSWEKCEEISNFEIICTSLIGSLYD